MDGSALSLTFRSSPGFARLLSAFRLLVSGVSFARFWRFARLRSSFAQLQGFARSVSGFRLLGLGVPGGGFEQGGQVGGGEAGAVASGQVVGAHGETGA